MDKVRTDKKKNRKPWYIGGGILAAAGITLALSQLETALPTVEAATLWPDTVRRGAFVREVSGPGTLVPEQIRIIPAMTSGRVEEVYVRPGQPVSAGTLLLRMTNPDEDRQLLDAERFLNEAQTNLITLRANLQSQILQQKSAVASAQTAYNEAVRQAKVNEDLARDGLIARNEAARTKDAAEEARQRLEAAKEQLTLAQGTVNEQISSQTQQVARLQESVNFQRRNLESMNVRAVAAGVLQGLDLQIGAWVNAGQELARVIQPGRLKATIRIPGTQIQDVAIGQKASIDTRNDTIQGFVVRIDPAEQTGTFGVDIALEGDLPASARPDLSIDGKIEIDRLSDVLHMQRPGFGQAGGSISLFKISPDGKTAEQVTVRLGRTSVNQVEIVGGLKEGDVVILSPMDTYSKYDKVRLK
ncbi:MAG TPA: HlyD family efflux transporter periplasmic adaptor subunit [Longimicrobiales bacterium]